MIMMPPEEIVDYITTDEDGNWIYHSTMPEEYIPLFDEFVKKSKEAQKLRWGELIQEEKEDDNTFAEEE